MADIKYKPVPHDHEAFLKKASKRNGFRKAYEDLGKKNTGSSKPAKKEPRKDWDTHFKQMKEDNLLIPDNIDLEMKEWEW